MDGRQLTRVRVGEHLLFSYSRRSLCDNCIADVCMINRTGRVFECEHYKSRFIVFKRCDCCGELFEVHSNIRSLDPDLCPRCNLHFDDSE
jgi:hypothetical protein